MALIIGFLLDLCLGDPYWLPHPIRWIGNLISFSEKKLRKIFKNDEKGEFIAGIFLVIIVISVSVLLPAIILYLLGKVNTYLALVAESIMCYQLLATKQLKIESMKVYTTIKEKTLEDARKAVSMIVGRDTENLDEKGVIKAAVETVAENTSDGIIAPMLYMAIGGAVFGFFYKAINTMDSMVGYKNEKYLYFGRAAAKLDDVVNYIPARISAYLLILSSFLLKLNTKNAYKIFKRDRYNHASPNSAQTESVCAGALEVQLAGDAYYFGKLYKKKTIGDDIRQIEAEDIKRVNNMLYVSSFLGLIIFSIIKFLILTIL